MIPAQHPDTLPAAPVKAPAAETVVAPANTPAAAPRIDASVTTRQTDSAAATAAVPQAQPDRITAAPAAGHSDSTRSQAVYLPVQPGRTTREATVAATPHIDSTVPTPIRQTGSASDTTAAPQQRPDRTTAETAPQGREARTTAKTALAPAKTAEIVPHVPAAHTAPGIHSAQPRVRHADTALPPTADTVAVSTADRDSLPFPLFGTADSLRSPLPETASAYREVPAEAVFGAASSRAALPPLPPAPGQSLTANPVFQGFVLLLAAAYALLLYHHLGDIRTLLSRISRDRASGDRLSEDAGGSTLARFLHISAAIGLLFIGVVTVKYGDSLLPNAFHEMLSHAAVVALSLLATALAAAIVCYQRLLLRSAGALTLSQPFMSQLLLLKRTYFALGVIVTSPPLLLFALCPRDTGGAWFWVIAIKLLVTALLYLRETLNLFISKKISILHWFLYLCTVEIFPLSLVWLAAGR